MFLDASALQCAVQRRIVGRPQRRTVDWGGTRCTVDLTQFVAIDPTAICKRVQRREARRLPVLAWLANRGRVELLTQTEVFWEFLGLRGTRNAFGHFFGAPMTHVESPLVYGRILVDGLRSPHEMRQDFFARISHPRFQQLKRATGAYQGDRPSPPNEVADTFHIWCAENAGADVFVTLDEDLVDLVARHRRFRPKVAVELPSRAIRLARQVGLFAATDYPEYRRFRRRLVRGASDDPLEQLVKLGPAVERAGDCDDSAPS